MAVGLVVMLFEGSLVQLFEAEGADKVLRVEFSEHGSDTATHDRLVARGTQGATLCMVMCLTVRLALKVEEATADERTATLPADEAVRVPLCVQSRDVVLRDGVVTASALGGKQVEVVLAAVRFPIHLMVPFLSELRTTHATEEMLRMPRLSQR